MKNFFLYLSVFVLVAFLFFPREKKASPQLSFVESPANISASVNEEVVICSCVRDVEKFASKMITSIESLGKNFSRYKVVVYENNSRDNTKEILRSWQKENPNVCVFVENLSVSSLKRQVFMKIPHKVEKIARARNFILDLLKDPKLDSYPYVIWVDWNESVWNESEVVPSIASPEHDFDGVFAFVDTDLVSVRTQKYPIGFELLGNEYTSFLPTIGKAIAQELSPCWTQVFSGFGGLGIYKKSSLLEGRYAACVTKHLDSQVQKWLHQKEDLQTDLMYQKYLDLLKGNEPFVSDFPLLYRDDQFPKVLALKLPEGKMVWFSCTQNTTFAWTSEHVNLHANMAENGKGRFYINPKIKKRL